MYHILPGIQAISVLVCGFFFTDQRQLIIRLVVNTLAKAKEHGKFCPLEKEGDTGFLGQCLHSCRKLQEILAIGNTWALTRFWLQQINFISRLYIIHLTPLLTQVLKFPEQNSSKRDLHSLWANSPCHQEHCYLLWKTGWVHADKLINPQLRPSHGCDLLLLLAIIPDCWMVGRLPSQAWGRMPKGSELFRQHSFPHVFSIYSRLLWAGSGFWHGDKWHAHDWQTCQD